MNMRTVCRVAMALGLALCAMAPAYGATQRILLVGDSWANDMSRANSFEAALASLGITGWEAKGDVTGIGATTAAYWAHPDRLQMITDEIAANPTIDIVHLSMGGNDLLGFLANPHTRAEKDAHYTGVVANIQVVVEHVLSLRPDIRVGISSYDYMAIWGAPSEWRNTEQYNTEFVRFSGFVRAYADGVERCTYLNHWGLMQHTYGVQGVHAPGELAAPGGPPAYEPFYGGNPSLEGAALRDSFHLNDQGYQTLALSCLRQQYLEWFGYTTPEVLAIEPVVPQTIPGIVAYRVTFNVPVTGVDLSDFSLETTGSIIGARIHAIGGDPGSASYTVYVEVGWGPGDITLILHDNDSIASPIPLNGVGLGQVAGQVYAVHPGQGLPVAAWPAVALMLVLGVAVLLRSPVRAILPR